MINKIKHINILNLFLGLIFLSSCSSDKSDIENPIPDIGNSDPLENIVFKKITNLSSVIEETSGLINFKGRVITHNDSGGKPNLYEIDLASGKVSRTVVILNAQNKDMEDITQDENYIYLCDVGNNSNSRRDQTIYKIDKKDYLSKSSVTAEFIKISFEEQTDHSKSDKTTNFDAEAVISIGDNLFLFTKNWGDLKTSVYKVPKEKGNYKLSKIDSYNIKGLITGADYNVNDNTIILTGYLNFIPFIVKLSDFSLGNPLDGKVERKQVSIPGSIQIEGVASNPDGSYYISAEKTPGFQAALYKMTISN